MRVGHPAPAKPPSELNDQVFKHDNFLRICLKSLLKISESLCCVMPFAASNGTLVEAGLLSWLSKTAIIGLFEQLKYTETLIFNRL